MGQILIPELVTVRDGKVVTRTFRQFEVPNLHGGYTVKTGHLRRIWTPFFQKAGHVHGFGDFGSIDALITTVTLNPPPPVQGPGVYLHHLPIGQYGSEATL